MIAAVFGGVVAVVEALLFVALALAFVRLARGPSMADRVVALDLMAVLMVAFLALFTVTTGEAVYLDVAIALSLVAFLATVAFARFAERRNALRPRGMPPPEPGATP
ncbi:MAG: hypothetical protein GC191_18345 [Azospirillum sp.]|nr:hypothetical protein [Azospirillum sp.]